MAEEKKASTKSTAKKKVEETVKAATKKTAAAPKTTTKKTTAKKTTADKKTTTTKKTTAAKKTTVAKKATEEKIEVGSHIEPQEIPDSEETNVLIETSQATEIPKEQSLSVNHKPLTPSEVMPVFDLEKQFGETTLEPETDSNNRASTDFYYWLNKGKNSTSPKKPDQKSSQKDLIENFLISKPTITRPKKEFFKPEKAQRKGEKLSSDFVTETLARIYLKQDNPEKAIWAYQQLQLKFPEKSAYFAAQIKEIEQNKDLS